MKNNFLLTILVSYFLFSSCNMSLLDTDLNYHNPTEDSQIEDPFAATSQEETIETFFTIDESSLSELESNNSIENASFIIELKEEEPELTQLVHPEKEH